MDSKEANEAIRTGEVEGNLLIAVERNSAGQSRMIHFTPPDGKGGDITYESSLAESELLERHPLWQKQGYNILFVGKNPSGGTLSAIWIQTDVYGQAVVRLTELGITPATIVITSGATGAKAAAAPVSVPLREWKDGKDRTIRASVEGVEEGQVKFVLADGRKVNYPLKDLGAAEQKVLTDLLAGPSAPVAPLAPAGFTDWMSFEDFEKTYADERANGRYAVYVETNQRDDYRAIFETRPQNLGWFYGWGKSESGLRESDTAYRARGLALLSLSYNRRSERYCALWVRDNVLEAAKAQLSKHNITVGSIGDEIKISIVPKE